MWQDLIHALKDLSDAYAALLEIAGRKRAILVAVDLKGLEPIVAEEEQQLERIRAAEKRRQDALLALSGEIPSTHAATTMAEVEAACPGDLRAADPGSLPQRGGHLHPVSVQPRVLPKVRL